MAWLSMKQLSTKWQRNWGFFAEQFFFRPKHLVRAPIKFLVNNCNLATIRKQQSKCWCKVLDCLSDKRNILDRFPFMKTVSLYPCPGQIKHKPERQKWLQLIWRPSNYCINLSAITGFLHCKIPHNRTRYQRCSCGIILEE